MSKITIASLTQINTGLVARIAALELALKEEGAAHLDALRKVEAQRDELQHDLETGARMYEDLQAYSKGLEETPVLGYHEELGYAVFPLKEIMSNPLANVVDNIDGLNIKPIENQQGPDVGQPAEQVLDQEAIDGSMSRMKWAETTGKPQWSMDPAKNAEAQRIMDLKASGLQVVVKWDKVLEQMKWALKSVGFEKQVGDQFLASFEVHIRRSENKFMFIPIVENEGTLAFSKDFIAACKGKKLNAGRKTGGGAWYTYK